VRNAVTAVDSSQAWLIKVFAACALAGAPIKPRLVFADIGPIGDWGMPHGTSHRSRWPRYYQDVWSNPAAAEADLFLVDGRFRVACHMSILKRCRPGAIILVHDFASRPHYHCIREVSRQIAAVEDLAVFLAEADADVARIDALLQAHAFDPS
jgi:hypothetical protein